jgi:anti-sigma factor RsiW
MTIEQKYFEFIQAAIDGEIDAADKDELDAFLAASEEGRAVYGDLMALCRRCASHWTVCHRLIPHHIFDIH